jgi:hypothetical protein
MRRPAACKCVSLIDQDGLQAREGLAQLLHQLRHHVLLAQLAKVVLAELGLLEEPAQQRGEQREFLHP